MTIVLITMAGSPVFAQAAPQWERYAACAAAYQANWQNRLGDPDRRPDMSAMIHDEATEYRRAAIGYYVKEAKASADEASRRVEGFVDLAVTGFIAMDQAGTLEAYIDKCPQLEDPN